jgi:predicted nucleic acid-binding OB-fold protein
MNMTFKKINNNTQQQHYMSAFVHVLAQASFQFSDTNASFLVVEIEERCVLGKGERENKTT